jgi:hypothetical protein
MIQPEERTQNIKASLFTYLRTNYTTTPIQLEGVQFDEENHNEWVRADMMVVGMDYFRQVGNTLFGADLVVILNLNVMVKADKVLTENIYRREQLVDELKHLFRIPLGIPVYDHFTGAPLAQIGIFRTTEIDEVDLGYNSEAALYQHNISSTMYFLSKWDAPS